MVWEWGIPGAFKAIKDLVFNADELIKKSKPENYSEVEPLEVSIEWVNTAKEQGVLDTLKEYRWSKSARVSQRELEGTHTVFYLVDRSKKTRRKVIVKDASVNDLVLMEKV